MNEPTKKSQLHEEGYTTQPFPKKLKEEIEGSILEVINSIAGEHFSDITIAQKFITSMNDDEFVKSFTKPIRSLQDSITNKVFDWVKEACPDLLGSTNLYISSCPKWEANQVDHLSAESLSVYWRSVRPNKTTDVAGAHQDSTFWRIAHNLDYEPVCPFTYTKRWKVWLPLFGCIKQNSLQILPESHRMDVPDGITKTEIGERPYINKAWLESKSKKFVTPVYGSNNQCVIFHDDLVHQGPINRGNTVRFSAEFTILVE